MGSDFFEGKTYKGKHFKGLDPSYYPIEFQQYIAEETELLKKHLQGAERVLDAGIGTGRIISSIAPLVRELVGVDNAEFMLHQARERAKEFKNVKIIKGNVENLSKLFPRNYFSHAICIWNTLGNVKDERKVLEQIAKVTNGDICITVFHKGTIQQRKVFYKKVDVEVEKIDAKTETFFLKGYESRAYSYSDLAKIASDVELKITEHSFLGGGIILWAVLRRT